MLTPTEPTPPLTGCGVNVQLPGYETPIPRPGATRTWLLDEDVTVDEIPGGLLFEVRAHDVTAYVSRDEMERAAAGVANLITAALHGARAVARAKADNDRVDEALAAMIAPIADQVLELIEAAA